MPRGPSRVRTTDLRKALQACKAAGESVARVEITTDGAVIVLGPSLVPEAESSQDEASTIIL